MSRKHVGVKGIEATEGQVVPIFYGYPRSSKEISRSTISGKYDYPVAITKAIPVLSTWGSSTFLFEFCSSLSSPLERTLPPPTC
jgi:hypothetical protein